VNTSNGGKAKKPRKRYDILKTASCSVCGDQAAEHLHYGGIACYSCRAFFRRTVNSNRPILDCSGTQNCKINKETRKRCQWCRFEKCKLMGMKTSWVLTEEDKTKLAIRRESSPIAGINVGDGGLAPIHIIKKEEDGEVSQGCQQHGNISVKQRHPSSPMASPPIPDHFDQTGHPQFKSRTSPYFQPHHPGPEGTSSTGNPFFANQFYPFQTGFSGHKMASDPISSQQSFYRGNEFEQHGFEPDRGGGRGFEAGQQASSLFPLNINKMQVSLTGNSDGVSFTIETHNSNALKKAADRAPPVSMTMHTSEPCLNLTKYRRRWREVRVGAAGTKPPINDILLRLSHLEIAMIQTPFATTSSRGPFSDVSQATATRPLARAQWGTLARCLLRAEPHKPLRLRAGSSRIMLAPAAPNQGR